MPKRASNKVVAGLCKGRDVNGPAGFMDLFGGVPGQPIPLNAKTVKACEKVTEEHIKSAVEGIPMGLVDETLLEPVAALAEQLENPSTKKNNRPIYYVAVLFQSDKSCLMELNERLYTELMSSCPVYSPDMELSDQQSGPAGQISDSSGQESTASAQEAEPKQETEPKQAAASASPADEIRKYKELMDDGIITEEEFEAKKKQLLDL